METDDAGALDQANFSQGMKRTYKLGDNDVDFLWQLLQSKDRKTVSPLAFLQFVNSSAQDLAARYVAFLRNICVSLVVARFQSRST